MLSTPLPSKKPDLLVVACGGNNICNFNLSPFTVASNLVTRFSDKGKVVIFCSALYRRENGGNGGNGTYPVPYGFRERASLLNSALLELTDSSPRHQFYELDRRLISCISNDHVHLTCAGERKLFNSLQRAIRWGLEILKANGEQ